VSAERLVIRIVEIADVDRYKPTTDITLPDPFLSSLAETNKVLKVEPA
jgi:hypothetical protein